MTKVEGLTIQVTVEMDDDVKALCSGYKQRILELEDENAYLRELLYKATTRYLERMNEK